MKTLKLAVLLALAPACTSTDDGGTSTSAAPSAQAAAHGASDDVTPPNFEAQAGWIEEQPANAMRAAQYRLPGEAGEATLIVYQFGPRGGTLEANLERWAGQFEQPDGGDSAERMLRSDRRVGGFDVVVVDLSGTYVAETSPGSGERVHEPEWRMLAAVIDAPEGAYYAKLVGPEDTVAANAAHFDAFLAGL